MEEVKSDNEYNRENAHKKIIQLDKFIADAMLKSERRCCKPKEL
jgi:hypothetical protein